MRGQGGIDRGRAKRVGDVGLRHAGDGDDVTGHRLFDRLLRETPERHDPGDAELFQLFAGARQRLDGFAGFEASGLDAAGQDAADERVGAKRGGQHLERLILTRDLRGRGDVLDYQVEQSREILARAVKLGVGPTGAAGGVEMREIKLVVIRAEVGEEVEHFVQRAIRFGIGLVDLVQHHDRAQAKGERLGGDEFRLRHRAFGGIDQQDNAIDHRQDAFNLAAEIGVAGGVDDVDAAALPFDGGGLGKDGDAAFAFQIVGIHRPFRDRLVFAECAGLFQKFVDQGGFAVVNVSDDRNIAQVHINAFRGVCRPLYCMRRKGQKNLCDGAFPYATRFRE